MGKDKNMDSIRLLPAKKLADIQSGFKKDCEDLLRKFGEKETHSFTKFSEVWKEKHFTLVFKCVKNFNDIPRQTQLFFFEVKKIFIYAPNVYLKTGSLYLLYGLYYKQPFKESIKIRLTHNELIEFKKYINNMKTLKQTEPMFVFSKLIHDQAFDFVYTQLPLAPKQDEIVKLFDMTTNDTFRENFAEKIMDRMKELTENESIAEIGSDYKKAMKEYFEHSGETNIMTFDMDIQSELKEVFKDVFVKEGENSENVEEISDDLGESRIKLKRKAAGTFKKYKYSTKND